MNPLTLYYTRPNTCKIISRGSKGFKFWIDEPRSCEPFYDNDVLESKMTVIESRSSSDDRWWVQFDEKQQWNSKRGPIYGSNARALIDQIATEPSYIHGKIWQQVSYLYDVEDIDDGKWLDHVNTSYNQLHRKLELLYPDLYMSNLLSDSIEYTKLVNEHVEGVLTPGSTPWDWVGKIVID